MLVALPPGSLRTTVFIGPGFISAMFVSSSPCGDSDYQMKGDGRFSVLGGLIYEWSGGTTSAGKLSKSGPQPSLYTLSYSGGDAHGDVRISFSGGAVSDVSTSPKTRPNPKNIPVTKEQLRGVLDPMTGAFLRVRPNLPERRPEGMR